MSFIGSLGVLLFCFGGLAVLVHTVTSHALQYASLNESLSPTFRLKVWVFLKQEEKNRPESSGSCNGGTCMH